MHNTNRTKKERIIDEILFNASAVLFMLVCLYLAMNLAGLLMKWAGM